jgi:hypothetical protein
MSSPPQGRALRLIETEAAPIDADQDDAELREEIAGSEERISSLEHELRGVTGQEIETARQLETRRTRRSALQRQLLEEREEQGRMKLEAATAAREAMIVDAEREAAGITSRAASQGDDLLAEAKREGATIVEMGRERLETLEGDAARRAVELDTEHRALSTELEVMRTLYDELQSTLKLVAENSFKELVAAKSSMAQLDQEFSPKLPTPKRRTEDVRPTPKAPLKDV